MYLLIRAGFRGSKGEALFCLSLPVRLVVLSNNYLQIRGIKKTDEGTYRCEGRILARGEINFKDIQVIVNGEQLKARAATVTSCLRYRLLCSPL